MKHLITAMGSSAPSCGGPGEGWGYSGYVHGGKKEKKKEVGLKIAREDVGPRIESSVLSKADILNSNFNNSMRDQMTTTTQTEISDELQTAAIIQSAVDLKYIPDQDLNKQQLDEVFSNIANSDQEVKDAIFSHADEIISAEIAGTPDELHTNPYFKNNKAKNKPDELHNMEKFFSSDGKELTEEEVKSAFEYENAVNERVLSYASELSGLTGWWNGDLTKAQQKRADAIKSGNTEMKFLASFAKEFPEQWKEITSNASNEIKFNKIISNVQDSNKVLRQAGATGGDVFLSKKKTDKIHSAFNKDIAAQLIISKGAFFDKALAKTEGAKKFIDKAKGWWAGDPSKKQKAFLDDVASDGPAKSKKGQKLEKKTVKTAQGDTTKLDAVRQFNKLAGEMKTLKKNNPDMAKKAMADNMEQIRRQSPGFSGEMGG